MEGDQGSIKHLFKSGCFKVGGLQGLRVGGIKGWRAGGFEDWRAGGLGGLQLEGWKGSKLGWFRMFKINDSFAEVV